MTFERWRTETGEAAVLGLGASGEAAARLLRREGLSVYVSDHSTCQKVADRAARLEREGVAVELGHHDLDRIGRAMVVVVSPGVPPEAAPVAHARAAGVEVLAEVDIGALALRQTRWVGITGTNGKTTTTALSAWLLVACGLHAESAGNIGRPVCEVALADSSPAWLAVELSSFQLHDAPHLALAAGVMTNLSPDHLDRYPSLDAYYADKARLFANPAPDAAWITNADDQAVQRLAAGIPGTHRTFSVCERADAWYDRGRRALALGETAVMPRSEFRLLGDHNVGNALAAMLVADHAGGAIADIADGLRSFAPLPHRLEPVREVRGVLWINDSKATNLSSTVVAIRALERPFVLLLGGRHKGEPYGRLAPLLDGCRGVVAFGEARPLIEADLGKAAAVTGAATFAEALSVAADLARSGDAVLLSPAWSRFDMFEGYEQRGARFRATVEAM